MDTETTKRKRGRPRLDKQRKRGAALYIKVRPDELTAVHTAADRASMTVAGYVRYMLGLADQEGK